MKAWQCLLSHALTLGSGPQHSSHEEGGEGGGGREEGGSLPAGLGGSSSRCCPCRDTPSAPGTGGGRNTQGLFLKDPPPPPLHPAGAALPTSALEASGYCSHSRGEQRGTLLLAKKQSCLSPSPSHMKAVESQNQLSRAPGPSTLVSKDLSY